MKRVFDVVLSVLLLLLLAIPMLAVAVAIWWEDRGPVFYRQRRVGRGTKEFNMLKFRSMMIDADQVGGFQTLPGDRRITRTGAFVRSKSLDELPQIFNVLTGDMSFVGPRPDVPEQENLYTSGDWQKRHRVRPGITGLAQVHGRSEIDAATRLACDLEYVEGASIGLDLRILLSTFRVIRKGF